jgi:hypothetical protein
MPASISLLRALKAQRPSIDLARQAVSTISPEIAFVPTCIVHGETPGFVILDSSLLGQGAGLLSARFAVFNEPASFLDIAQE